jgi:dGTPase
MQEPEEVAVTAPLTRRTRADRERVEDTNLSPLATRAAQSRGREADEPEDDYRTAFERDRDRILHSKAFRRLKHKTQVFLNPDGDHYVTRMTHTLQVAQVGRSIAAALGLNEALTEAQCLGHDIGHSLFGHTGEEALSPYLPEDQEWQHAIHGVRVVSVLEPLNLTWETLDGIRQSSWKNDPPPSTPEGMVLRFADRIAYLSHDALDAMRAGVLTMEDLPPHVVELFGTPGREWIDAMIRAVIDESVRVGEVAMEPTALQAMHDLRDFMFSDVYLRPESVEQAQKATRVIRDLFEWFRDHPQEVPTTIRQVSGGDDLQAAMDHVAGMSDKYAIREHDRIFRPAGLY